MNSMNSKRTRSAGLMVGTLIALATVTTQAAEPTFDNLVKLSFEGTSTSGNTSALQARTQKSENGAYGVEELKLSSEIDKGTVLMLDIKSLAGINDTCGVLKLTKEEVGSAEIGYKRSGTFYDGIGGFFPTGATWKPLTDRYLTTYRSKFWADFTVALPNLPVFNVRYTNELRSGQKDTTVWGDTDFTGIPIYWGTGSSNLISSNRKVVAGVIKLSDRKEVLEASVKHTMGSTTLTAGLSHTSINNMDIRSLSRYPGELAPFPVVTPTTPTLKDPAINQNAVYGDDSHGQDTKTFAAYAKFVTVLNDKVSFFGGTQTARTTGSVFSARQLTTNLRGPSGMFSTLAMVTSATGSPGAYTTSNGSIVTDVWTSNLGADLKPTKDLFVTLAVKYEDSYAKILNQVNWNRNWATQSTGVVVPLELIQGVYWNKTSEKATTPELDIRYQGIRNVSLYANVDYRSVPGSENGVTTSIRGGKAQYPVRPLQDTDEKHTNFKAGANWTVSRMITLRAEFFSKDHDTTFTASGAASGVALKYKLSGANVSAVVTPNSAVNFTTKYTTSKGKYGNTFDGGAEFHSGDVKLHTIGESVNWNPCKGFYAQAGLNFNFTTTITSYGNVGGMGEWTLHNADGNYWTSNLLAGMEMDKDTDLQLEYSSYGSDNYNAANAYAALPYGASDKSYQVTLGVKHKFSSVLLGEAKLGYYKGNSDTTGGNTNYNGTVAYAGLTYAF